MNVPPAPSVPPNPYVGPRAFTVDEAARFYGRTRETQDLLDLLIAERIVLLYSPSGAGKSSLIQAALLPALAREGFAVLPIIRVTLDPAQAVPSIAAGTNRYLLNTLLSLEEGVPPDQRLPSAALTTLSLDEYLNRRAGPDEAGNPVLIFDQFEEILATDPLNRLAKQQFFDQVGIALRNQGRWALFAMREDFVAGLDPYVRAVPTRLSTTYRLDLLGLEAARQAIQRPARGAGIDFTDPAAQKLLTDLCRVRVQQPDGTMAEQPGPYVEPVQLQVVCLRLWAALQPGQTDIGAESVASVGDVDTALADYYATELATVAGPSGVAERAIRDWFEHQLITPQGLRGQVLAGPGHSAGLDNAAIARLVDTHLVRAEKRRGATWFELAHDRLIAPIQQDNARWFAAKLSPLQRQAALWAGQDRPGGLLLRDRPLAEAEAWARTHALDMTEVEQDFLTASRAVEQAARRERRNNRLIRVLAVLATLIMLAAVYFAVQAQRAAEQARVAQGQALAQAQIAQSRQLAAQADALLGSQPDLALLLSVEARRRADTVEARGSLLNTLESTAPLITFLRGHSAEVLAVAFSPDGQTFASAGCGDKTECKQQEILQWSTTQLRPVGVPVIITGPVISSLAYTANGQHLVLANHQREVTFWNVAQQRADGPLDAGTLDAADTAWSVAAGPGGDTVAVGTEKGTVLLFEPGQGQTPRRVLQLHRDRVLSLAFSADGTLLASGSSDGTVIIWDVRTGTPRYPPLVGHVAPVAAVAFAPDGSTLAAGGQDNQIRLWDLRGVAPASRVLAGHTGPLTGLAFGEGGRVLVSASRDTTIRLWDPVAGLPIATLAAHQGAITGLAFHRDGRTLAAASEDHSVSVWDVTRRQRLGTPLLPAAASITTLDIAADGTAAAWSDTVGQIVLANIAASPPISRTLPAAGAGPVSRVALSADGGVLAVGGTDGTIWMGGSAPPVRLTPRLDDAVSALAFSPDGTLLAAASCARPPEGVCRHSRLVLIAVPSGEVRQDLITHDAEIAALAFSPDGRVLASGARELAGTTLLWGLDPGLQMRSTLQGQGDWVVSLAFNHAGGSLATASRDRSIWVWDATAGTRSSLPLLYREGYPTSLAFSPDDHTLAAGDSLGRVVLWDWTSAQQVGPPLALDSQRVLDLGYAPSSPGLRLIAGDARGGLITWDMAVESWEAQACAIANRPLTPAEWDRYMGHELAYRPTCP